MSTLMFSSQGVHYEGGVRGSIIAIYVAGAGQIRAFPDLQGSNAKEISERYGSGGKKTLWRMERGQVVAYGVLPVELAERRESVSVYLPEQILPSTCTIFYFVFGNSWLVHGVKIINDDGQVEWGVSRLAISGKNAADVVVNALSEKMLDAGEDNYCIAVTQNDQTLSELKEKLQPFDQEAIRLESLKPVRTEPPIYKHQNHGLVMIIIALLAFMVVITSGGWWLIQTMELNEKQKQVEQIRRLINQIQLNERIGYIRNPKVILARMDKSLVQAPSTILNAGAQLGAKFGKLEEVVFEPESGQSSSGNYAAPVSSANKPAKLVRMDIRLSQIENEFLIDQENLAKALLEEQPWVRDIKSYNKSQRDAGARLEVVMRIE
ncbi:MAG: hypothetical protein OXQ96_03670 [Alphaproteobacteria bacterium]|nr:hypothetical protein [Alphaproteobacteria bacterium]